MSDTVKDFLRKMGENTAVDRDRDAWRKRAEEVASDHLEGDKTEIGRAHV